MDGPLVSLSNIDPDEIPEDPGSRFLSRDNSKRRDSSNKRDNSNKRRSSDKRRSPDRRGSSDRRDSPNRRENSDRRDRRYNRDDDRRDDRRPSRDRKKIKGRGRLTYRPETWDRSRSRSRTPPHWRAEKNKTISLDEYEKLKVEKAKKM